MSEWNFQLGVHDNANLPHGYYCLCPNCQWDFSTASLENRAPAMIGFSPEFHRPWNDTLIVGKGVIQCPLYHSRFWIYLTQRLITVVYTWKAVNLGLRKFLIEQFADRLALKGDIENSEMSQAAGHDEERFTVINQEPGVRISELRRVVEWYYRLRGHAVNLHKSLEYGCQYKIERRGEEALRVAIVSRAFRAIEVFITLETIGLRLITARLK